MPLATIAFISRCHCVFLNISDICTESVPHFNVTMTIIFAQTENTVHEPNKNAFVPNACEWIAYSFSMCVLNLIRFAPVAMSIRIKYFRLWIVWIYSFVCTWGAIRIFGYMFDCIFFFVSSSIFLVVLCESPLLITKHHPDIQHRWSSSVLSNAPTNWSETSEKHKTR